jgi:hypothetical protein
VAGANDKKVRFYLTESREKVEKELEFNSDVIWIGLTNDDKYLIVGEQRSITLLTMSNEKNYDIIPS